MQERATPSLKAFMVVWGGQTLSSVGSYATVIGLTFWVYDRTVRATDITLIGFFSVPSGMLATLSAGVIVDRTDRKSVMIAGDSVWLRALVDSTFSCSERGKAMVLP
jgi:DHA3 family macrolide efflux protein-like MFS transporter